MTPHVRAEWDAADSEPPHLFFRVGPSVQGHGTLDGRGARWNGKAGGGDEQGERHELTGTHVVADDRAPLHVPCQSGESVDVDRPVLFQSRESRPSAVMDVVVRNHARSSSALLRSFPWSLGRQALRRIRSAAQAGFSASCRAVAAV